LPDGIACRASYLLTANRRRRQFEGFAILSIHRRGDGAPIISIIELRDKKRCFVKALTNIIFPCCDMND
jgi:hypothetical protein